MVTLILSVVIVIALATAALAVMSIRAGMEYDEWCREFEKRGGIQTALCPVLNGPDIVGYTVIGERRSHDR